jgi:hypothetical protein
MREIFYLERNILFGEKYFIRERVRNLEGLI